MCVTPKKRRMTEKTKDLVSQRCTSSANPTWSPNQVPITETGKSGPSCEVSKRDMWPSQVAECVLAGVSNSPTVSMVCSCPLQLRERDSRGRGVENVRDIQETILVLVFFVNAAHERGGGWQDLIDEDEDGLLGRELDALADHVDELTDGEIGRDEVFLLVDGRDIRLLNLLANHL